MTMHDMNCAAIDERLADYLEGDLDVAAKRQFEAHVASCVRCTALVRDLERIRVGAAELPELTPSMDLWNGIARRIETPVVPFAARPLPNVAARRRTIDRLKTAAIAAALVAVSVGVTYELTTRTVRPGSPKIASTAPSTTASDTNTPSVVGPDVPQPQSIAPRDSVTDVATPPTPPASTRMNVTNSAGPATSSNEIDRLRTVFLRNRAQLDPRTAAIIEANLKVIDEAIAQSKAALSQDPASRFLTNQLNSALDKKRELLRTAALLPSRT